MNFTEKSDITFVVELSEESYDGTALNTLKQQLVKLGVVIEEERTRDAVPTKADAGSIAAIVVLLGTLRACGPVAIRLMAEWLHRPGKQKLSVRSKETKSGSELTIESEGLTPAEFTQTVQKLSKVIEGNFKKGK
ncbi:hypothetical protein [Nocardia beijingensis]